MIKGMVMDVPGIGQSRYATWEDLNLYCYRVAGPVGLMSLPIFGTADGYTEDDARDAALSLGVALQITNILRDVGEDARRGRIYLPQEDMERFGVTEEQIMNGVVNDNYRALMRFEIDRAEKYYKKAQEGVPMLSSVARFPTQAALDIYRQILTRIVANDFDNLSKRAYVSKWEKFSMLTKVEPPTAAPKRSRRDFAGDQGIAKRPTRKVARQKSVLMKQGKEKEPVGAKLFGPENAGPWLILVVVWGFLALIAVVPREDLPPFVQDLIPLVLGRQYGLPPGGT
jgi:hypothetical protein